MSGINYILSSFGFLSRNKGLKRFFVIPFFLNIALLGTLIYFACSKGYPLLASMLPESEKLIFVIIRFIAAPLFGMILAIATVLIYSVTGSILSSFFYDLISQRTETIKKGAPADEKFSIKIMFNDTARSVSNAIKMLCLLAVINGFALLLNLIPVAGTVIYTVITWLSLTFFFGFQFIEFSMDRKRMTFKAKIKTALKYKWSLCGIGTGFLLLTMIPVIGFLTPGIGAVSGTLFFIDVIEPAISSQNGVNA